MDYSGFVRDFYRTAFSALKSHIEYNGPIANIAKPMDVPAEFLHNEPSASMFMPQVSVNIDAPTKYFIEFMDYQVAMMPHLGVVFANKERLAKIYDNAIKMDAISDDEKANAYISALVRIGIEALEQGGVLA